MTAGFALLYPPYIWIPAFAGMTEEGVRQRRTGSWGIPTQTFSPGRAEGHDSKVQTMKDEV